MPSSEHKEKDKRYVVFAFNADRRVFCMGDAKGHPFTNERGADIRAKAIEKRYPQLDTITMEIEPTDLNGTAHGHIPE